MGVFNLGLAISISKYFDLGIYGVALAGAIVLTLKNTFFIPIYSAKTIGVNAFTYFKELLPATFFTFVTFGIAYYVNISFTISSWFTLLILMMIVSLGIFALIWLFGLNIMEKNFLMKTIFKLRTKADHA
jgi:membrane protein EpsK